MGVTPSTDGVTLKYEAVDRRISADSKGSITRVRLPKGEAKEFYLAPHTSILTRSQELINFMAKPYLLWPSGNALLLVVPKWVGLRAGFLLKETESYYVFRVDVFAKWANLVPEEFERELKREHPDLASILEPKFSSLKLVDNYLTGRSDELEEAWRRYRPYLRRREESGIRVAKKFNLMVELVKDGVIPWVPRELEFRSEWETDIRPRDYQAEALEFFRRYGNVVILWPPGTGKTTFGLLAIAKLSLPTLIVCPNLSLVGQWQEYLKKHLFGPTIGIYVGGRKELADVVVTTYQSAPKLRSRKWGLVIFDEVHHLPAPVFSQLAGFERKATIGLTATPYREDFPNEYIFALCGFPYGQRWEAFFGREIVKKPVIRVITTEYKLMVLKRILEKERGRVLVFCDSIDLGNRLSRELGIPFVYGKHPLSKRKEFVDSYERLICSRIFDEGMDIQDIEAVVEVDFLFGSRRQELQRVGRAMHTKYAKARHYIIMTPEELARYGKRLYSLFERDFEVRFEAV